MPYDTQLSIVIVNDNAKRFLEQCLYSVRAATQGMETDIYVVDKGSTDGSIAYLRPLFPEVTFVENKENVEFAKANHQAFRICRGEYVLMLQPDTAVGEESLRSLCCFMDEHPEAGALGLKMLNGNGVFLAESKPSSCWMSFCKLIGLAKLFPNTAQSPKNTLPNEPQEVETLSDTFRLMRHDALDKINLSDEGDLNLSSRFLQAGYKNYYMPERMLHYEGEKIKKGKKARRVLVVGRKASFDATRKCLATSFPKCEFINLWNLDEERITSAVCRKNQMKRFTDIVFVYPDARFEQMFLLMDLMPNKQLVYHIYHRIPNLLISPEK